MSGCSGNESELEMAYSALRHAEKCCAAALRARKRAIDDLWKYQAKDWARQFLKLVYTFMIENYDDANDADDADAADAAKSETIIATVLPKDSDSDSDLGASANASIIASEDGGGEGEGEEKGKGKEKGEEKGEEKDKEKGHVEDLHCFGLRGEHDIERAADILARHLTSRPTHERSEEMRKYYEPAWTVHSVKYTWDGQLVEWTHETHGFHNSADFITPSVYPKSFADNEFDVLSDTSAVPIMLWIAAAAKALVVNDFDLDEVFPDAKIEAIDDDSNSDCSEGEDDADDEERVEDENEGKDEVVEEVDDESEGDEEGKKKRRLFL